MEIPARNDISFDELIRFAEGIGCKVSAGGKHPIKVFFPEQKRLIPISRHGKFVKEAYIEQVQSILNHKEANQ